MAPRMGVLVLASVTMLRSPLSTMSLRSDENEQGQGLRWLVWRFGVFPFCRVFDSMGRTISCGQW